MLGNKHNCPVHPGAWIYWKCMWHGGRMLWQSYLPGFLLAWSSDMLGNRHNCPVCPGACICWKYMWHGGRIVSSGMNKNYIFVRQWQWIWWLLIFSIMFPLVTGQVSLDSLQPGHDGSNPFHFSLSLDVKTFDIQWQSLPTPTHCLFLQLLVS